MPGTSSRLAALGEPPPVLIVICPNTIALSSSSTGLGDEMLSWSTAAHALRRAAFLCSRNVEDGVWTARLATILIDSEKLELGEPLGAEFRKDAAREIEAFKQAYRLRNPGADVDKLTDADLLREAMNTIGKKGKLGEHIRCVVSVAMLTEGWDANTVTHILGVRPFRSQLLCEQVVGRGLRRRSYAVNPETGHFEPEYAEIYGVPFAFIPGDRTLPKLRTRAPPLKSGLYLIAGSWLLAFRSSTDIVSSCPTSPCMPSSVKGPCYISTEQRWPYGSKIRAWSGLLSRWTLTISDTLALNRSRM